MMKGVLRGFDIVFNDFPLQQEAIWRRKSRLYLEGQRHNVRVPRHKQNVSLGLQDHDKSLAVSCLTFRSKRGCESPDNGVIIGADTENSFDDAASRPNNVRSCGQNFFLYELTPFSRGE
jgi:hypothetical protein